MTGFELEPKTRRIEFDDTTPYPGLWMRVGGLTLDEWTGLKMKEAMLLFADRLIEWNLEIGGEPVPATAEGVGSLDISDVWTITATWSNRCAELQSGPLDQAVETPRLSPVPDPEFEAAMPMSSVPSETGT